MTYNFAFTILERQVLALTLLADKALQEFLSWDCGLRLGGL